MVAIIIASALAAGCLASAIWSAKTALRLESTAMGGMTIILLVMTLGFGFLGIIAAVGMP